MSFLDCVDKSLLRNETTNFYERQGRLYELICIAFSVGLPIPAYGKTGELPTSLPMGCTLA